MKKASVTGLRLAEAQEEPEGKMDQLPSGTVTFLFTDIEGSTRLLESLGPNYSELLERHRQIIRDEIDKHDGKDLGAEGDGNFAAFQRAGDAVAAAVEMQKALQAQSWSGAEPKVRMGIHTGDAFYANDAYIGLAVHKAKRICSAAHGGQILVSEATRALVGTPISPELVLTDLGLHRLKDLGHSERLFQVAALEFPATFPPLRTLDVLPNNLPAQLTSFIGREDELERLDGLLKSSRLVTLLGAGGSGKTRLALQVAAEALEEFPDGAWFVDLSVTTEPEQVTQLVTAAIGIREDPGRMSGRFSSAQPSSDMKRKLLDQLAPSCMLVILDNCEHVIDASAELADSLLRECPRLTVLATSRQTLGVSGEIRWSVPPLDVPGEVEDDDPAKLLRSEAVRLFVERAALSRPGFALNRSNAESVGEICHRLDGLPLAIELAAAWIHALTPQQILERLDDQFRLLASTVRGAPNRQQTLRAAVDWSYQLLSVPERRLLEALAVFSSSFSLDAAEQICSDDQIGAGEVLSLLALLINKSLVIREGEGADSRYRLLETIRHYGRDKLVAQPEAWGATGAPQESEPPSEAPTLRREGEYWTVEIGGEIARLKHIKGLSYLHHLLASPEKEWHVLDLVTAVEGHAAEPHGKLEVPAPQAGDSLEIIDPKARRAYRQRLVDLQEDLDETEAMGNRDRAASIKEEMEALAEQLAGATGLAGRSRTTGSASERARLSVTKAIRTAVHKIGEHHQPLAAHLERSISTGTFCSYRPDPAVRYEWRL